MFKLAVKKPEQPHTLPHNFKHISHLFLVFLLFIVNWWAVS